MGLPTGNELRCNNCIVFLAKYLGKSHLEGPFSPDGKSYIRQFHPGMGDQSSGPAIRINHVCARGLVNTIRIKMSRGKDLFWLLQSENKASELDAINSDVENGPSTKGLQSVIIKYLIK
jgi:hypothetical protein